MALVALIAASELLDDGSTLRALAPVAGETIVERQAARALGAGAEILFVVVAAVPPELLQALDRVRRRGVRVQVVRDAADLQTALQPTDRVLLVADGLMAPPGQYKALATGSAPSILVTADTPLTQMLERVDAQHRWGGLALVPASSVAELAALPGEWDIVLTLLRFAIQAGAARFACEPALFGQGEISVVSDSATAAQMERVGIQQVEYGGMGLGRSLVSMPIIRLVGPGCGAVPTHHSATPLVDRYSVAVGDRRGRFGPRADGGIGGGCGLCWLIRTSVFGRVPAGESAHGASARVVSVDIATVAGVAPMAADVFGGAHMAPARGCGCVGSVPCCYHLNCALALCRIGRAANPPLAAARRRSGVVGPRYRHGGWAVTACHCFATARKFAAITGLVAVGTTSCEQGLATVNRLLLREWRMHDAQSLHGLTDAAARWSGHHAALAARLGQPGAVRLTEEQEALALGIARRLVHRIAGQLPLKTSVDRIWARWESTGLPSASLLAPSIFARVEEYRWRRMMTGPLHDPLPGLFADMAGKRQGTAMTLEIDANKSSAVDSALLALRIADGARSDAFGLPLLLPAELPAPSLRALLFDAGAQDLAQVGDMDNRAPEIAVAVECALADQAQCQIDAAASGYVAMLEQADLLAAACVAAITRHDWLAVIAVVAIKAQLRFAEAAATLVAADEDAVRLFFGRLGVSASALSPLLDSLAEVPGRPGAATAVEADSDSEDVVLAFAARAESLRARQRGDRP